MQFSEIAGNDKIKNHLINLVKGQRIPHALMLSGPEGCGKVALAWALAQFVNCENRLDGEPCNQCPSCVKMRKLEHPDLHFVFPVTTGSVPKPTSDDFLKEWKSMLMDSPYISLGTWLSTLNAENKQPQIYVHETDSIIKKLTLKPYESEHKIMIIYMPERMNVQCSNKLLKLIEEPPEKTILLLVSENKELLLPTIISRCQIVNVPKIDDGAMLQSLSESYPDRIQHLPKIIRIANGNKVKAIDILEQSEDNAQYLRLFIDIMRASYKKDVVAMKKWSDDLHGSGRERQKGFLTFAQHMIRESFVYNFKQIDNLNYLTEDEEQFCVKFASFVNERNIAQLMELFDTAQKHIERNVFGKMVFFDIALQTTVLLKA